MRGCVGTTERVVRALIGLGALLLALQQGGSALAYVLYAVAVVAFVTALVGRCPLWAVLGIQTCDKARS